MNKVTIAAIDSRRVQSTHDLKVGELAIISFSNGMDPQICAGNVVQAIEKHGQFNHPFSVLRTGEIWRSDYPCSLVTTPVTITPGVA